MPWYRIPTDMNARAARYAATAQGPSEVQKAALELMAARGDEPAVGGVVHINFGRKRGPLACSVCGWISERLCDRIVDRGVHPQPEPQRCSAPLCESCTYEPEDGKDLCPECVQLFKAWLAGRTNSTDGYGA